MSLAYSKPDFFIVGAQKCGTTSLYNYLVQHPCVLSASVKEIHYFSDNYHKGCSWYKKHYPSLLEKYTRKFQCSGPVITGEATPYYLFHPHAPARVKQLFPQSKIIVMLRNPIDRAYSHYRYHVKLGAETLSFEEAIEAEPSRLQGELERMIQDESYNSSSYKLFSYLARGIYIEQLKRWLELFPKEQVFVIKSEAFFSDPAECFRNVQKFLGLPERQLSSYKKFNAGASASLKPDSRAYLNEYFRPHNQRLYELLDIDFEWY